jgi:hypothetical protein
MPSFASHVTGFEDREIKSVSVSHSEGGPSTVTVATAEDGWMGMFENDEVADLVGQLMNWSRGVKQ